MMGHRSKVNASSAPVNTGEVRRRLRVLRYLALRAGYNSLAESLRDVGVTYQHIWEVLRGNRTLSQRTRQRMEEVLGPEVREVWE